MNTPQITGTEKCPASGRTAAWCTDQTHATWGVGIAAGIAVDRKVTEETEAAFADNVVVCKECDGLGVIPAGIDRESGRDPGRACWKFHGYREHTR